MSRNALIGRLLTPTGFAAALALFLLPFLTFSCAGPSTPSEGLPVSTDVEMSANFTGVDLLLDQDPTVELRQDSGTITIDSSDLPTNPDASAEEQEPMPTKIRAPMIGSAAVLLLGVLLALIPGHAVRRLLAALFALLAAGALAYVIYVAAPQYLEESTAEAGGESGLGGVVLESAPAVGFWAIIGVLGVVLLLQLIPTPRPAPVAPASATPMPPSTPHGGVPASPGWTG